jgi:hypothetical protein
MEREENVECSRSLQCFHDAFGGRCWRGYSISVAACRLPLRAHFSIDLPSGFVMSLSIVTFIYNQQALKCHTAVLLWFPGVPFGSLIQSRMWSMMAQSFSLVGVGVHALLILIFPFIVQSFSHM